MLMVGGRNAVGLAAAATAAPVLRVVTRLKVVAVVAGTEIEDSVRGVVDSEEEDEDAELALDFCFPLPAC